ncbi:MAG TPA: PTS sugar transporter subunit IIABC [Pseudolysinimonas sp.]|jgi:PTS system cellobiose-specific IIB component
MDLILVVCGAGASSTFLAARMRTLATERGLDVTARAASNLDVASRVGEAQVLLVGPHLAARFDELRAEAAEHSVPAALLPATAFGPEGAAAALAQALALLPSSSKGASHG